ncbi:MAG: PhoU domain-containing protein, partial [Anaerolineales bacterium]
MARETRETLDNKIRELNDTILELGSIVEQAILGCVNSLVERNLEIAKTLYDQDKQINEKRYEIERKALIDDRAISPDFYQ